MRAVACVLAMLALAGCSVRGEDKATVEASELSALVLQPEDLPREFVQFDQGRQVMADNPGGRRIDPRRFGRREGWKARYHRRGGPRTAGPVVVESRADLFESAGGAHDDLEAARRDLADGDAGWQPIDEPGLGNESFAATLVQRAAAGGVRYYHVYWRSANVVAFLNVNGFEGRLALAEVLELARKQQRRITAAAAGG